MIQIILIFDEIFMTVLELSLYYLNVFIDHLSTQKMLIFSS